MSRIPYIMFKSFTETQHKLFANVTGGKRGEGRDTDTFLTPEGGMKGPFNAWLRSPVLGETAQRLGEAVRFEGSLPPRLRELAILTVAAKWKAQYEWCAHERIAKQEGMDNGVIESLKAGVSPDFENSAEAVVYDFSRELINTQRVSDRVYEAAVGLLGEAEVVELVLLLGYYTLVSMTLNVFEVPLPAGEEIPFVNVDCLGNRL